VDNHCDGIYLYEYMKNKDGERAEQILGLITANGGNRSGSAISSVDWEGNVYIDQFTRDLPLGNIRDKDFGEIWDGVGNPLLDMLRNRKEFLKGRCAACKWLDQCNGNFRARAKSTGDFWASDPACYLTDEEIGI
jgi:radical SAM protein with 4Fe4S-binding SPASM domain